MILHCETWSKQNNVTFHKDFPNLSLTEEACGKSKQVKRIPATELEAGDFVLLPDIAEQATCPRTFPTSIPDFAHVRAVSHSQQGVVLVAGSFAWGIDSDAVVEIAYNPLDCEVL